MSVAVYLAVYLVLLSKTRLRCKAQIAFTLNFKPIPLE